MLWYGFKKSGLKYKNMLKNLNYNHNLKTRSLSLSFTRRLNLNKYDVYLHLPNCLNFIVFVTNSLQSYNFFFYNNLYFFYVKVFTQHNLFKYDNHSRNLVFFFNYRNNFYKIYWKLFKDVFYSFIKIFFKKLKFKGKGYYVYKNSRNTIALQFGYSHRIRVYSYFVFVKFLSKTSILIFGISKDDILQSAFNLYFKKPQNIFTLRGIRFTKQIVYKKAGKLSSYR